MPEYPQPELGTREHRQEVVSINDLYLSGPNGDPLFRDAELSVYSGELVHLHGANGAGKTTLLRCMTGFESPESGTIRVIGIDSPRPEQLWGKVGFLFQNPERQFFEETVYAEVGFSLRRMGTASHHMRSRLTEALDLCNVGQLAARSPLTLSFGEQHRVALASVIAPRPDILFLDEPFSGLDYAQRFGTLQLLSELRRRFGTTVVLASHDPLPSARWADRKVILKGGRIEEA